MITLMGLSFVGAMAGILWLIVDKHNRLVDMHARLTDRLTEIEDEVRKVKP